MGCDLSKGFENFVKHDDSQDEHLVSLLKTIASNEQETRKPIDAHIVTWRGIMTKVLDSGLLLLIGLDAHSYEQIMSAAFEDRDGYAGELLAVSPLRRSNHTKSPS